MSKPCSHVPISSLPVRSDSQHTRSDRRPERPNAIHRSTCGWQPLSGSDQKQAANLLLKRLQLATRRYYYVFTLQNATSKEIPLWHFEIFPREQRVQPDAAESRYFPFMMDICRDYFDKSNVWLSIN
jgi:hypothetical protein